MNFYGDSFHVTAPGYGYTWSLPAGESESTGRETARKQRRARHDVCAAGRSSSRDFKLPVPARSSKPAPPRRRGRKTCDDVNRRGHRTRDQGRIGRLHAPQRQATRQPERDRGDSEPSHHGISGEPERGARAATSPARSSGTRARATASEARNKLNCNTKSLTDCFIGRFGWLGDRVVARGPGRQRRVRRDEHALERRVQSAVRVTGRSTFPLRYAAPNCGPANKTCVESNGNANLTETDIDRMADYARWLGNPTRSEFQVALTEVDRGREDLQAGEVRHVPRHRRRSPSSRRTRC